MAMPYRSGIFDSIIRLISPLVFLLAYILDPVNSANILGLFAYPGKSHFMVLKAIMMELAKKGNNVTVVSSHSINEKLENYNELLIDPPLDYWSTIKTELGYGDMFEMRDMSTRETYQMMNLIGFTTTDYFLENNHVKNLINNAGNQQFDLIIVEQFFQDAVLMFGKIYKAPVVAINTYSIENHMSTMMGLVIPWAHSPQDFLPYCDRMNFWERLHNTFSSLYSEYNRKYNFFPQQHSLIRKHFGHLSEAIPSMEELEKSVSVLLANNYIPLDIPKPMVMGIVYIGGVHIPPPKNIVWDIKRFIDDSPRGVIYFSLGTNLKSSDIPQEKLKAILNVFKKLKQRVLWKWEDEYLPNCPDNVMIKKWIPQSDVLAHPHVNYFITHGGLLSIQEAVYRNVPILGIPIFGDQHINMKRATELGFGFKLDYHNLTEESFSWAINELITNPQYSTKMREISKIFRDRPVGAMHTAIYWIDYVIRHKGGEYLKPAAVDIPWYSLYLIDIILFIGFCIFLSVITIILLVWLIYYIRNRYKENQSYKKIISKEI
ncbi:UDP-glycosyltransferase UGT5-like [Condylostylus longicornis]|uniref:UDP-glycosyltransferase UGT5-like n=1 Tax=Condylostylus longicornis TaxID=2530218 RepID=UPI00244D9B43|nr:UDP-glycosyltransferase UGT5-like [Condylostylus longicornis]